MTDAGGQYAPGAAAHGVHVELLFAPMALEYEPAPQGVHAAEPFVPISSENVPAGQTWQEVAVLPDTRNIYRDYSCTD